MTYNPDKAVEKKIPESGDTTEALIISINDGKIKDFVIGDALKKFENPDAIAIHVISQGKYDNRFYECKTLFSYEEVNGHIEFDARSNLGYFKKQYGTIPTVGQKVKHIANAKGYFKLLIKV